VVLLVGDYTLKAGFCVMLLLWDTCSKVISISALYSECLDVLDAG
jgi:hypothetical protein